MPEYTFHINEENQKIRLDIFLAENIPDVPSRTFIQRFIENGEVLVNGKQVKPHHKVVNGDEISARITEEEDPFENIQPENIALDIFYEDKYLLVINKPAGLLVHPVHGSHTGTLVNALLHYCQELSDVQDAFRPGIVHRLDRDTSGLILVAKDNRTHVRLARQFEKHRIMKRYVALVRGNIELDEGLVDAPLGKHHTQWDKKAVSFEEDAKEARTVYRVLKHFDKKATLVALYPESGRTHQLRVHMAYLGHPILGDEKYGPKNSFSRLALHAQAIGFTHPETKAYVEFSSPIPEEILNPSLEKF